MDLKLEGKKKKHKWTTVISVITEKKREKRKIVLDLMLKFIAQSCVTQTNKKKPIKLAFYFLSIFSDVDSTVINLIYNFFDLLKRITVTVALY